MAGIRWWTKEKRDTLRQLILEGVTYAQIARQLTALFRRRVTIRAVAHMVPRMGLVCRRGRPKKGGKKW